MTRSIGALLFAWVVAACGGAANTSSTTPKAGSAAGSSDPTAMTGSGDPAVGSDVGTTGGGAGGATPGTGTPPPNQNQAQIPQDPQVVPPNLDPDPGQAKAQVDQHLSVAKSALAGNPPDADGALREAKQALAIDGTNVDAAAMVAFAYYHKHLFDTAELVLDDVFKRDVAKKNANIYYVYGLVYDKTNRPDQAKLAFQTAVQLDPNLASALVDLGEHQLQNKQYDDATQTFERLTGSLHRTDAVTWTSLGSAYRGKSGDLSPGDSQRDRLIQNAETAYKKALGAAPGYGPALYNLGLLYFDSDPYPGMANPVDRVNMAKQYFDQYKTSSGSDQKLYDERMKDVTKALKRLQKKAGGSNKAKSP
jgi:tetratricopeptide (TPR) repeat protein|nr:tetratricopeptide repeat protein [Kofleriaceae bacterium]